MTRAFSLGRPQVRRHQCLDAPNWKNIASIVKKRSATGAPVLVVHSAVTGITDKLEKLLEAALQQKHEEAVAVIEKRHRDLADELGIGVSPQLEKYFSELRQIAAGVALVGEVSDKTRARASCPTVSSWPPSWAAGSSPARAST